jgi:arsenate reductase
VRRLARKTLAEAIGSAGLACAVVGSGIAAERLSPGDVGLQLLENSIATALALAALLLALGPVSGAHLNPAVTVVELARRRVGASEAAAYVTAQVVGCAAGAVLANAMFDLPAVHVSARARHGGAAWLSEAVATFGLLVAVHGTAASASARAVPFAVAGYVGAAYWFTSSTAFANPAVTLARTLSDTFAGISPTSVPTFVVAQAAGTAAAFAVLAVLLPGWASADPAVTDEARSRSPRSPAAR